MKKQLLRFTVRFWIVLLLLSFVLVSCSDTKSKEEGYVKTFSRGDTQLTAETSREEITTAGKIAFSLTVTAPWDADVRFPSLGGELGQFTVSSAESPKVSGRKGRQIQKRVLILEPFLSGIYYIPAVEVKIQKKDSLGYITIASDPIRIDVKSLLGGEKEKVELKENTHQEKIPIPVWVTALICAAGVLLAAAGFFLFRMIKKKNLRRREEVALSPYELAVYELNRLRTSDYLEKGRIKDFYFHLSTILRQFLEGRFGLKAPERTTEEFLRELKTVSYLEEKDKKKLADFLLHCDRVKFARYIPSGDETEAALSTCSMFIEGYRL